MGSFIYLSSCRYYLIFGIVSAALVFSSAVNAAYVFDNNAQIIANWDKAFSNSAFKVDYPLKKTPDNTSAPSTKKMPVKYRASGVKNLLSLKSFTPAGLAWTVALAATPYLFDSETGQVMGEGEPATPASTVTGICGYNGTSNVTITQCLTASAAIIGIPVSDWYYDRTVGNQHTYGIRGPGSVLTWTSSQSLPSGNPYGEPAGDPVPISDDNFINDVAPNIDWDDVVQDSSTGEPITSPEYTQSLSETNNWYTKNYTDNDVTQTTTSTTTIINNPDGSQTATETAETDLPAFCSWAGIMCDLANWIMEEPEQPDVPLLPVETIEVVDWNSGLGSGSCPPPVVTPMMGGGTHTTDYTIACDAATTFVLPVIIFLSLLGAGYILTGTRRG